MKVHLSAYKHGISNEDIIHAYKNPLRYIRQGDDRVLIIGAAENGMLLEIVALDPQEDPLIIHAMKLRNKFTKYLY